MTTYSKNYHKIYEENFGPIPVDSENRTYEIHHIDGNRNNNDPSNLKAVSIQEHYDIHYSQGDYGACWAIAKRMKLSSIKISELAALNNKNKLDKGIHHFQTRKDGTNLQTDRVKSGTHHLLKKADGSSIGGNNAIKRLENGTHNFLGPENNKKRVDNGTHNFLNNKGTIPCYNKEGQYKRISKEKYNSQKGLKENWEWSYMHSKEGKRRKGA
jgi:HNH endonuclease